jgi:hypothetical protein
MSLPLSPKAQFSATEQQSLDKPVSSEVQLALH